MTNIDKYPRPVKWISKWMGHGTRKSSFVLFFSFCYAKEVKGVREHGPPAPPLPLIYLLKVNNRNTRTRGEICSNLAIKTAERYHWRPSDVFIVNFEHISHHALALVFVLLAVNNWQLFLVVSHSNKMEPWLCHVSNKMKPWFYKEK